MNNTDVFTITVAVIGAVTGILGAVLGVINTWQALARDRVRLIVVPKVYVFSGPHGVLKVRDFANSRMQIGGGNGVFHFCIEVINRGFTPVTVSEVGFVLYSKTNRYTFIGGVEGLGQTFPHRLESLSSATFYSSTPVTAEDLVKFKIAYCETDCGRLFTGDSPAFRDALRWANSKS